MLNFQVSSINKVKNTVFADVNKYNPISNEFLAPVNLRQRPQENLEASSGPDFRTAIKMDFLLPKKIQIISRKTQKERTQEKCLKTKKI